MIQTFTANDLVRHLYTEESPQEADRMNYVLSTDENLIRSFHELSMVKGIINNFLIEPSDESLSFIFEFSRITA